MDFFNLNVLLGVVNSLITPQQWFLNRYFPIASYSETKLISFDVIDKTRRLAPFVSPVVAGKVVKSQGITTKFFEPAYIKDKRIFNANRALKRAAGEPFGGNLTGVQRMQAVLANELLEQVEMVDRRLELMASEALRTGKAVITGDDYPTVEIDFGRKASLTVKLTGSKKWSAAGSTPLKDIRDWSLEH
jgi:Phage major capsid protein E